MAIMELYSLVKTVIERALNRRVLHNNQMHIMPQLYLFITDVYQHGLNTSECKHPSNMYDFHYFIFDLNK